MSPLVTSWNFFFPWYLQYLCSFLSLWLFPQCFSWGFAAPLCLVSFAAPLCLVSPLSPSERHTLHKVVDFDTGMALCTSGRTSLLAFWNNISAAIALFLEPHLCTYGINELLRCTCSLQLNLLLNSDACFYLFWIISTTLCKVSSSPLLRNVWTRSLCLLLKITLSRRSWFWIPWMLDSKFTYWAYMSHKQIKVGIGCFIDSCVVGVPNDFPQAHQIASLSRRCISVGWYWRGDHWRSTCNASWKSLYKFLLVQSNLGCVKEACAMVMIIAWI